MQHTDLKGLTCNELEEFAVSIGEPKYRGKQLFDWLYMKEVSLFSEMSSFSKPLRERLDTIAVVSSLKLIEQQQSSVDATTKFLFELSDGKRIESVLIPPRTSFRTPEAEDDEEEDGEKVPERQRLTLCVSTQVGCPLDCQFCATATMGSGRNLTTGEIIDQVLQVKKLTGKHITNLVYMGMGEPFLNYDNVMSSVEIISTGLKIAAKRITISTAGLTPNIRRMADENRKVKLAISLHSLDDKARTELMPINKKYNLTDLIDASQYYYKKLKQRITFEYILFDGWNDRDEDIHRLVKLSRNLPCKVNIIPFHSISFTHPTGFAARLRPTPKRRTEEFVERLRSYHVTVFVRSSAGEDIDAACGQLAVKTEAKRPARKSSAKVEPKRPARTPSPKKPSRAK